MKRTFKVTETVVTSTTPATTTTVKARLSEGRAKRLSDKLNDKEAKADFNPDRMVTYMAVPA